MAASRKNGTSMHFSHLASITVTGDTRKSGGPRNIRRALPYLA
jgi:hypothetical protein